MIETLDILFSSQKDAKVAKDAGGGGVSGEALILVPSFAGYCSKENFEITCVSKTLLRECKTRDIQSTGKVLTFIPPK